MLMVPNVVVKIMVWDEYTLSVMINRYWLSMGVAEYTDLISLYGGEPIRSYDYNIPGKILKLVVDGTIWVYFPTDGWLVYKWYGYDPVTKYY